MNTTQIGKLIHVKLVFQTKFANSRPYNRIKIETSNARPNFPALRNHQACIPGLAHLNWIRSGSRTQPTDLQWNAHDRR